MMVMLIPASFKMLMLMYSGALVKTMSRIGDNRFFWPQRDDVIWYEPINVLGLIPEPVPVTKRHKEIIVSVWREICEALSKMHLED